MNIWAERTGGMQRRYEEHDTAEPAPHPRNRQHPNGMKRVFTFSAKTRIWQPQQPGRSAAARKIRPDSGRRKRQIRVLTERYYTAFWVAKRAYHKEKGLNMRIIRCIGMVLLVCIIRSICTILMINMFRITYTSNRRKGGCVSRDRGNRLSTRLWTTTVETKSQWGRNAQVHPQKGSPLKLGFRVKGFRRRWGGGGGLSALRNPCPTEH